MVRRVAVFTKLWVASFFLAARGLAVFGLVVVVGGLSPALAVSPDGPALLPSVLIPAGATPYLRTHAVGTQNYVCVATGSGLAWKFAGPQATLFVSLLGAHQQVTTHFLSPNPDEADVARATWQGSFDSSRVWAKAAQIVDDTTIIGTGNIPWLLLTRVGARRGPTGGSLLSQATWIQRIHTVGGVAPSTGCSQSTDAGAMALVPYSTDYVFFR
jgi:hypothetical protein